MTCHKKITLFLCGLFALTACSNDEGNLPSVKFTDHSVTPALVKKMPGFENLEIYTLISSDDILEGSPNFIFGGYADGAGVLKDPSSDGYLMVVNHENNFAVSRLTLDKTFKPIKGEYILNSDGGKYRLCSATLATPEEHGFGPVFLTAGETNVESQIHALDPFSSPDDAGAGREVSSFGHWNAENAVPLPKDAYSGKTVIIIGDDDSSAGGGQVALYVSNTVGDLTDGELYMLRRTDLITSEMDMVEGQTHTVEFVKIQDFDRETTTGAQINTAASTEKALMFGRVEDLDYRKGGGDNGREVYFNVTGQNNTGVNASYSRSKYGRVYKLVLDKNDPLKGVLSVVLNGDNASGIANEFQNVDNIYVGNNFLYTSEDPGSNGNLAGVVRDGILWQYNLGTKELKKVFELDQRRDEEKYNKDTDLNTISSEVGDWEYGALIDLSGVTGQANSFALCIQPHSWRDSKYVNPDGGGISPRDELGKEASQILIIKGLPK